MGVVLVVGEIHGLCWLLYRSRVSCVGGSVAAYDGDAVRHWFDFSSFLSFRSTWFAHHACSLADLGVQAFLISARASEERVFVFACYGWLALQLVAGRW